MRKNRKSSLPARTIAFLLWWLTLGIAMGGAQKLPIYIEESHAGSFYFLADRLAGAEKPHRLILFDAHSDASAIYGSDQIRAALAKCSSAEQRDEMFRKWRTRGVVQCFDWIEPLMPELVTEVVWIPQRKLTEADSLSRQTKARSQLDAHEEAEPRSAGAFANRYHVMDFETWEKSTNNEPTIVSIDLDYFASMTDAQCETELDAIMQAVLHIRSLTALTFSISSPFQPSHERAERLLLLALDASFRIVNATVQFEPFATTGRDKSLQAMLMERRGKQLPAFQLAQAGGSLQSLLVNHAHQLHPLISSEAFEAQLARWQGDPFLDALVLKDHKTNVLSDEDEVLRPSPGLDWSVELKNEAVGTEIQWWILRPKEHRYHVGEIQFGFGAGAPKWIWCERVPVEVKDPEHLQGKELLPFLDPEHACGTLRVGATVIRDGVARDLKPLLIAVKKPGSSGLQANWSEEFGLPYVFGSTFFDYGFRSGASGHWGTDCANFLIQGFRREGWLIPWGSPGDFTKHLVETSPKPQPWLIASFGQHMAGLWEDRTPLGEIDDNDLFVHQLESQPEVKTLGELKHERRVPKWFTLPELQDSIKLLFVGDLMLSRSVGERLNNGESIFAGIHELLKKADATIGNLECALTSVHEVQSKPYRFAAPPQAARTLQAAGFKMLGMGNNHTMDFGAAGMESTLNALHSAGIVTAGAGKSPLAPAMLEIKGKRIALFSVFCTQDKQVGLATTADPETITSAIETSRDRADLIIMLPHWGNENSRQVTAQQRSLAKSWLLHGADVVIGSGPHVVQETDFSPHGYVAYSLGNAVFDGVERLPEWQRGAALELWLDKKSAKPIRAIFHQLTLTNGLPSVRP